MSMYGNIQVIAYDPAYAYATAQAFLEVFTTPPWNETVSLSDVLAQLATDYSRDGFGGVLTTQGDFVVGFVWWFSITGRELHEQWRPRFQPKENIPLLEGRGVYLSEFGVATSLQNRGLGQRLLKAGLEQMEPQADWIAVISNKQVHSALALLKSQAFEELPLVGIQVPDRICLIKEIYR